MVVLCTHLVVWIIRRVAQRISSADVLSRWVKLRTLTGLTTSVLVFVLYFAAIGFALREFGVSLTAYLASASILGLAIGFGSQGLVQDVVTGLTVIFSDLFQVGDLVEISGQSGIVQTVGMRFTVLLNSHGAQVFIPNRNLANVVFYPRGYVRCFVDITLSADKEVAQKMTSRIAAITEGFVMQFCGILRDKPEFEASRILPAGRVFVRVKFHIWPGRSLPIQNGYKPELFRSLKHLDLAYEEWMIAVNEEVSERPVVIPRLGRSS